MTIKKTKLPEGFDLYIPIRGTHGIRMFILKKVTYFNALVLPKGVKSIDVHYDKTHHLLAISHGGALKVTSKINSCTVSLHTLTQYFNLKLGSRWRYSKTEGKLDIYEEEKQ